MTSNQPITVSVGLGGASIQGGTEVTVFTDLSAFVTSFVSDSSSYVGRFTKIASDGQRTDDDKIDEAKNHIADISCMIKTDYQFQNPNFVDKDGTLQSQIATILLTSGRVRDLMGLGGDRGALWDELGNQPEFQNSDAFNAFVIAGQRRDKYHASMAGCCVLA